LASGGPLEVVAGTRGRKGNISGLRREGRLGVGRMRHVASLVVDEKAVRLVRDWIKQLPE